MARQGQARRNFSCDFETTTNPDDCRVWAYGYMEVGNFDNYKIGNSMEEFMHWVKTCNANLYFHNLKFDGSFIINYLMKNGFKFSRKSEPNTFNLILSGMGQWYMIDICYGYEKSGKANRKKHTVIYDSLKKLPFSVKKIGQDFGFNVLKGDIDYHLERPIGWVITPDEYKYIKNDIEIVARALDSQFKQGLTKMTSGSDSLEGFKNVFSKVKFKNYFPVLSLEIDKNIRMAYRGGFTWLNKKYAGLTLGDGLVFDVNSLYPSQMYDRDLPYGMPIFFEGQYQESKTHPLYIQHIQCEFELKEGYIPCVQIKNDMRFKPNEYLETSDYETVDLYMTNVDLDMFLEHYEVYDLKYIDGWKFRSVKGIFKDFIDRWMYVKENNDGAVKAFAKLMLNSLYGKFATNPIVTGKYPILNDNGSLSFKMMEEEETKKPVYTPMGIFITSWARHLTISTAQKCYDRIIYCDTDSIHLVGLGIPEAIKDDIHDSKLGKWAFEGTFKRAKYIRQKTYYHVYYGKEIEIDGEKKRKVCDPNEATLEIHSVKCAGMPDRVKKNVTFDNFKVGFTSYGKLLPKQVDGGVVLIDTEFTIK